MPSTSPPPRWAGRALALLAIALLAANLRSAVAVLAPIATAVAEDIPLGPVMLGVLGMLAPLSFAISGLFAPRLSRWWGLETALGGACTVMIAGLVLRAVAPSPQVLVAGTAVTFLAMGVGNVLLPPAVKKYFPQRIGVLTSAYAALMAISATVPAALAVPLEQLAGWRFSLGVWAAPVLIALVPWVVLALLARRRRRASQEGPPVPPKDLARRVRRSPIAWALALAVAVSSLHTYTVFAWLPQLLVERAGASVTEAGGLVALYIFLGLPLALTAPVLTARLPDPTVLLHLASACFAAGYLGLLLVPEHMTVLWVVLAGTGPIVFPVMLVLITTRARTPAGATALSGFAQGLGYLVGALGPLGLAVLHEATGDWSAGLVVLLITGTLASVAALVLRRPGYADDPEAEGSAEEAPANHPSIR